MRATPVPPGEPPTDLALDATLRAALRRRAADPAEAAHPFHIRREDLHRKVRQRLRNSLVLFVVDASESMGEGTDRRMAAAKGAVLALLTTAYQQRDRVGLVAFRQHDAEVLLRPTNSVSLARERLQQLPTGGATPLADGLRVAWELIRVERAKDSDIYPLLVLLSDGEANVPMTEGAPVEEELLALARRIAGDGVRCIAIDTRSLAAGPGLMRPLAEALQADYHHLTGMQAGKVVALVRQLTNISPLQI